MFNLLHSKKGYTLVELIIVLAIIGLGSLALINMFRVAYKTFDKSQERYHKQELVKDVSVYLSKKVHVNEATSVEVFDNLECLPEEGDATDECCYLYTNPADGLLYVRNAASATATAINNEPLYIMFKAYRAYEDNIGNVYETNVANTSLKYQCMITCYLGAIDNDITNYSDISDDDIFYSLTVPYHFPNMIERNVNRVNTFDGVVNEKTVPNGVLVRFRGDESVFFEGSETSINAVKYCFIATASYGGDSSEVGLLCEFRDNCLLTNPAGREFVKLYYKYSPAIADVIAENEDLRTMTRIGLTPLIILAEYALNPQLLLSSLPLVILFIAAIVIARATVFNPKKKGVENNEK